jgi:acetyl-CoA C-acetyltransferase
MTFPGLFAELAKAYRAFYRLSEEEFRRMLAAVSALGYRNGAENPLAQFGPGSKPAQLGLFTPESILALPAEGKGANLMVAPPLRLHDCSLISDGAAALVLAAAGGPPGRPGRSVRIAGIGHTVDHLPLSRRQALHLPEAGRAARDRAFAEAGIGLPEVDLAEVHDCFSINHLMATEALGLSEYGRSGYDYLEGRFTREDRCPVNLSGGLKAKGHPVGATGASMHVLLHRQLIGEPIGAAPARPPGIGVLLNVGGSVGAEYKTRVSFKRTAGVTVSDRVDSMDCQ